MEAEGESVTDDSYDYYERPGTSTSSVLHHLQESQMILMDETTQMSMKTVSEMSEQQILPDEEIDDINGRDRNFQITKNNTVKPR